MQTPNQANKGPVLLIMAAGLGSRYGDIKQKAAMGPGGEWILEYSLYDAYLAGFKKAVMVIREDIREEVMARAEIIRPYIDIELVCQDINDLPEGYSLPQGRTKPWGTGHAVWTARNVIHNPFVAINADDFYGRHAFKSIYDFLANIQSNQINNLYAMVGYLLKNTLTDNGHVSRGVCHVANHKLLDVKEYVHIISKNNIKNNQDSPLYSEDEGRTYCPIDQDTIVSMNYWGFSVGFFNELESQFKIFLDDFNQNIKSDKLNKTEFFLPSVVDSAIKQNKASVQVLQSEDKWYGITHKDDADSVQKMLKDITMQGLYPEELWKKR